MPHRGRRCLRKSRGEHTVTDHAKAKGKGLPHLPPAVLQALAGFSRPVQELPAERVLPALRK